MDRINRKKTMNAGMVFSVTLQTNLVPAYPDYFRFALRPLRFAALSAELNYHPTQPIKK
jgi:hypothetical protein